jgi:hypothetical protein
LEYQIANNSGVYGNTIKPNPPILITENQQLVTLNVPLFFGNASTIAKVKVRVTDNVGCISPWLTIGPIAIPTQVLNVNWSSQFVSGTVGAPNAIYTKSYQIVGGIPSYTTPAGQPLLSTPTSTSASANVALNNGLTITVQDSVGCLITKNSG